MEGQTVRIPVTWEADHDYHVDSPATGLYVFTAKPEEAYTIAAGIEAPRITVYIHAKRLLRMEGGGTSASPLEITTAAQLAEIATLVNAGRLEGFLFNDSSARVSLKLMNDLDLSAYGKGWNEGKGWIPIGTNGNPFKGTFDGNNHKITGLFIKRAENYIGLFGCVSHGTVQNLGLEQVNITCGSNAGGVAGCVTNQGSVTGSYAIGSVSGSNGIGGVAGYVTSQGSVTGSYAAGTVTGKVDGVGGVAGYVTNQGSVSGSYATGTVTGTGNAVGGVAGWVNKGSVTDCAALNPGISGSSAVGRVVGYIADSLLTQNVAFSGMKVKINGVEQTSISGTETNQNGAGIDAGGIKADGTIGNRFTAPVWTVENGKLPILAAIPADVQDAAIPAHLAGGEQYRIPRSRYC